MASKRTELSRVQKRQQLYELAAAQSGYFTAAQARDAGYSRRVIVHHVTTGHFERIARGFYRLATLPRDSHDDVVAAWLGLDSSVAVVSHETALALYDLVPSRSREIHVTVPRERRPRARRKTAGLRVHTTTVPLRRNEIATRFGLRLTTPVRTIADVAASGTDPSVVMEAAHKALQSGLVSAHELRTAIERRSLRSRRLIERAIQSGVHA